MSRVAAFLPFATALALLLGAQAAPAEAGKIGKAIATTATKTAVKSAIRSGKADKNEDDAVPTTARALSHTSRPVGDMEDRNALAKQKLEDENAVAAAATSLVAETPNAGIVCLAGCN